MKLGFVALALFLITTSCSNTSDTIAFEFPNGYRGLVLISESKDHGVTLKVKNRRCVVVVPPDGHLQVDSFAIFSEWHKTTAEFKSGEKILDMTSVSSTQTALFELPTVSGMGMFFFVGTRPEFDTISQNPSFYKLPLARRIDP